MSSKITPECKHIISLLRPIVISRKQPCSLNEVLRDYRELEGANVPYKKFGFQSIEEFLQESGEFILNRFGGETCIAVKHSKNSAHITSMVKSQKCAKTKKRPTRGAFVPTTQFRLPQKSDQSWNKSSYSSNVYQKMSYGQNRNTNMYQLHRNGGDSNNNNQTNRNMSSANQNKNNNQQDLRNRLNTKKPQQYQQNHQSNPNARPILGQNSYNNVPRNTPTVQYNNSQSLPIYQTVAAAEAAALVASQIITAQRNQMQQSMLFQQARARQLQMTEGQQQRGSSRGRNQQSAQRQPQQQPSSVMKNGNHQKANNTGSNGMMVSAKGQATATSTVNSPSPKLKTSSVQDRLRVTITPGQDVDRQNGGGGSSSASTTPLSTPSSAGTEHSNNPFVNNTMNAVINNETKETKNFIPPNVFQFNPELSPVTSLQQYCIVRRYARPEFKILKSKFTKKFQCRVLINGSLYSTYPDEHDTEEISKVACAGKAIEEIKVLETRHRYPLCEDSDCELALKIYQELKNHPHGVFAKNFTDWFENTFQQSLPDHWFSILESSNQFITEMATVGENMIIFANCDVADSGTTSSASSEMDFIILDRIALPWESKYWNMHITHCVSTVEVWARLFGPEYSAQLDNLLTDIDVYMLTDKARPTSISCGQIYLVCISECWHRVRVDDVDKTSGKCWCFFIDFGDDDWLPVDQIYICESKFLKLPPQAVLFSLFGLEDFAENPTAKRHLDMMLIGKSLVSEILTKRESYDLSLADPNECNAKIQVVLYDTSSNEDVNLNPLLMNKICDDTPPPELKKTGVTNVNITHVTDNGEIYLQVRNLELVYVQKLINQLVESKFKEDQHKVSADDIKSFSLFLIRDLRDNSWYRGTLMDEDFKPTAEYFNIFYIDYGLTQRTHISQIFRLESLSAALTKYPRQGLKARLHNLPPVTPNIVARIRGLLPFDSPAIVKLVQNGLVPQVSVYKRFEGNQNLFNVNECIRIEYELESSADATAIDLNGSSQSPVPARNSPSDLINSIRSMTLKTSPITVPNSPQKVDLQKLVDYKWVPKIGELFDIVVATISNPYNFTIQPYADYPKLVDLMTELQDYCENSNEFIPADMVERGEAYAALNSDGFYNRVIVENVLSPIMIHVFFCDFGHFAVLSNDKLKILPARFRHLPKQALQAKLHGIKPKHNDWTMEDCLRFKKLTFGEKFVSVIKNITNCELSSNPNSKIIELHLIDVKTDKDVYIHEVFLEEDRAVLS